jgi:hypothetical protein
LKIVYYNGTRAYRLVIKDNLKIKREERRREENPLRTPILVPIGLLIRRGSVLEAKLRIAKRLSKARAVTYIEII